MASLNNKSEEKVFEELTNMIKSYGGYIEALETVANSLETHSMSGSSKIMPAPLYVTMTVTFPYPVKKNDNSTSWTEPFNNISEKVVKEKLTDKEIIERYNQIMSKKSENKQPNIDDDWVELEI